MKKKDLYAVYRFRGFIPDKKGVKGKLGDPTALVIPLKRRQKKRSAGNVEKFTLVGMTHEPDRYKTCRAAIGACFSNWKSDAWTARYVAA